MVTLEELAIDHFELAARWLSKPGINRWLTAEWRNRTVQAQTIAMAVRNRRNQLFLIKYGNQPSGLACLADVDTIDQSAMIWYLLGEESLGGKGIASEAVMRLVCLSFQRMQLASLYAWVMEDNVASMRVLHKAGFREVGRIRCATSSGGRQVDRVYYDILPSETRKPHYAVLGKTSPLG